MKVSHRNDNFYASYGECCLLNEKRSEKIFIAIRHSDNQCVAVKSEQIFNEKQSKSIDQVVNSTRFLFLFKLGV